MDLGIIKVTPVNNHQQARFACGCVAFCFRHWTGHRACSPEHAEIWEDHPPDTDRWMIDSGAVLPEGA